VRRAGLGRAAFAARFTRLVGQPVHRYLVVRRMDEAALMLESSDAAIARIATRVGYDQRELQDHDSVPGRDICKLSPQLKFGLDALY
jgi:transcriptional regulator GlxA family with amidase domain